VTKTAWYPLHVGDYTESDKLSRRALEKWKIIRGPVHKDTLNSVNQLGSVLIRQGKPKEAEKLHQKALEEIEKVLGSEALATLTRSKEEDTWPRARRNSHQCQPS
jgi:ribosomal protein S7